MRRATGSHALLPGERAKFFNDFDRAAVLADVVASTSSSLSPACVDRMARIKWPAIKSDIGTIAVQLDVALGAVMTTLAQALKWPAPELVAITMVRLDMIANRCRLDDTRLGAVLTERVFAQLMPTNPLPTSRRVQLSPGHWLATHAHGSASHLSTEGDAQ
jgi:hypothetical protein